MKTFKQYLIEDSEDLDKMIEKIKTECSEFISKTTQRDSLYRGMEEEDNFISYHSIRTDRKPRNTPKAVHDVIDSYFEKRFNLKYRSSSVFCSQTLSSVRVYGKPYFVFPVNGYKICASNIVRDLWNIISSTDHLIFSLAYIHPFNKSVKILNKDDESFYFKIEDKLKYKFNNDLTDYTISKKDINRFDKLNIEILDHLKYRESKILAEFDEDVELMVAAKGYYAIKANFANSGDTNKAYQIIEKIYSKD